MHSKALLAYLPHTELPGISYQTHFGLWRIKLSVEYVIIYIYSSWRLTRLCFFLRIFALIWRAPISSIYYNGTLGKVTYETPMGGLETTLQKETPIYDR